MCKTADQILSEAPVSARYDEKMAFYCTQCPWWTNTWKDSKKGDDGKALCPQCYHPLKEACLGWYIEQHRSLTPEEYQMFLDCFSGNARWAPKTV